MRLWGNRQAHSYWLECRLTTIYGKQLSKSCQNYTCINYIKYMKNIKLWTLTWWPNVHLKETIPILGYTRVRVYVYSGTLPNLKKNDVTLMFWRKTSKILMWKKRKAWNQVHGIKNILCMYVYVCTCVYTYTCVHIHAYWICIKKLTKDT